MKCIFRYFDDFVRAVFNVDDKNFFKLVDEGCFSKMLSRDTNIFPDVVLPLHYITICWDIILSKYDEWKEEYKPIVLAKKMANDRIKDFFISKCHENMDDVPFYDYVDYFFYQEEDADAYDFIGWTKEDLMEMGYREMDIDLYCYVNKFDFGLVMCLLKKGANPSVRFCNETDCMDKIGTECAFLEIELEDVILSKKPYEGDIRQGIIDLLGLAAHEEMYSLLLTSEHKSPDSISRASKSTLNV